MTTHFEKVQAVWKLVENHAQSTDDRLYCDCGRTVACTLHRIRQILADEEDMPHGAAAFPRRPEKT